MPSRANEDPSYTGTDPLPVVNPPPCIQTRTGCEPPRSGVQMFRFRHSSPAISGSDKIAATRRDGGLSGVAPYSVASRIASQVGAGCGGWKRLLPNGAAAYGT